MSQDKTTKTELQKEADPDVLRAKQAATSQLSATNNVGLKDDIGTGNNKAVDQTPVQNQPLQNKSNLSWLVWVIMAIVIIGIIVLIVRSLS